MAVTLESFRLRNFKAVRDTGVLKFGGFTVLIGGNGSGKSSLLEGLEVFHALGSSDVDAIFNQPRWRGFHHVWNKAVPHALNGKKNGVRLRGNPMGFEAVTRKQLSQINKRKEAKITSFSFKAELTLTEVDEVVISEESYIHGITPLDRLDRSIDGIVYELGGLFETRRLDPGTSILSTSLSGIPLRNWQFLNLNPPVMGQPTPKLGGKILTPMASDGSNLAEFIRKLSPQGKERLADSLKQILGYAGGLDVGEFSSVDRTIYFMIQEGEFQVPGWLMSGGSVRLVAILACLYSDEPPPLLVIEEIENGLDPRTVGYLVGELREAVESGRTQVIVTTHSPHFLSQAALEHLLLCQRMPNGEPKFWRPADSEELRQWAEDFNPGELFATGRIQKAMTKALRKA